jgi:hypothetical protein
MFVWSAPVPTAATPPASSQIRLPLPVGPDGLFLIGKEPVGKPVPIHDQWTNNHGWALPGHHVIRDEEAWNKLWAGRTPPVKADFHKHMVVVVGEKPRGRGVDVYLEVRDTGAKLLVIVHHQRVPPNVPIFQDIIWPSHLAVIDRSTKPIEFVDVHHRSAHLELRTAGGPLVRPHQPRLTFEVDGQDLLVSTTITANGSPHALATSFQKNLDGKSYVLAYHLIQNSDVLVRCQKNVNVVWRLPGQAKSAQDLTQFRVQGTTTLLTTVELANLLPQLQQLHKAGVNFQKGRGVAEQG